VRLISEHVAASLDFSQEMSCELCSHSNFVQGPLVGGAGVSPAVLRRNGDTKIASGTLAPPNPAARKKVLEHQSDYSNRGEKYGLAPKDVAKQRDDGIQSEPLRDHLDVTHPTLSLRSAGPHGRAETAAKFLASRFPGESLTAFPRRYCW
jgi:hypothetical protein